MRKTLSDAEVMGAGIGAVTALIASGLLGSVRGEVSQADSALVLVLIVIGAAATGGRWAGAATALVAAAGFDFFLTRPYGSLAIKSRDDIVTTILLMIVGIAVGTIALARGKAVAHGRAGAEEVAGLYRVTGLTADGVDTASVVDAVEEEVAAVMRLRTCRFEPTSADASLPVMERSGRIAAPYVFEGDGFALPDEGVALQVREGDRALGWLICQPPEGSLGVSRDRRRTALVLADYLALVLVVRTTSD